MNLVAVSQASAYDQQHLEMITHGCHWMINIEIRLIIFFAAKDGEALHSQPKKKTRSLTVVQIMNSLVPIQT